MNLLIKLILNIIVLFVVEYLLPGVAFADTTAMIVTAIVIGAVNTFVRPILHILFLPISIVTLGIGAFLINVVLLWGVSYVVPGFSIDSFTTAAIASILLALISAFLHKLAK